MIIYLIYMYKYIYQTRGKRSIDTSIIRQSISLGLEETLEDSEVWGDLEDAGAVNLASKGSGRRSHLVACWAKPQSNLSTSG